MIVENIIEGSSTKVESLYKESGTDGKYKVMGKGTVNYINFTIHKKSIEQIVILQNLPESENVLSLRDK